MRDDNIDHNLDDLIVPELKNNNYKNLLTILALLIILIFVAISFANTLIDTKEYKDKIENNETTTNTEKNTSIKPKTTKHSKEKIKEEKTNSLDNIFDNDKNEMPSPIDETKDTVELDDGYDVNYTTPIVKERVKSINKPMKDVTKDVEDNVIQKHTKDIEKEIKKVIKPKEIIVHRPKHIKKIEKPKVKSHHITKPHKTVEQHKNQKGSYYIQVGSFRNYPSKRFLSVITNTGFKYIVTNPNSNGIRRLLIGGYPSRAVANGALKRVKDRINKHSYIIKR